MEPVGGLPPRFHRMRPLLCRLPREQKDGEGLHHRMEDQDLARPY